MQVVMFYHSLVSDWNHGNAHFLRGIVGALQRSGHDVRVYEPRDGWSRTHLVAEHGREAIDAFARAYPHLRSHDYDAAFDFDGALADADLVIVHEWNTPEVIARIGRVRARRPDMRLLFHDTHHRTASNRDSLAACDLSHYDGVLAYGRVIEERYLAEGWVAQAWTWHEAADTTHFRPMPGEPRDGDLVWIGNWGEGERADELVEFLVEPVARLGLRATVHGVRYPPAVIETLARAGIRYGGWLPNHDVPRVFARHAVTVHVPRRPYVEALPGIPTIRPFEAMACGIPLVSAPWRDVEGLFRAGRDYLVAANGREMTAQLEALLARPAHARAVADSGRETILARHTCDHRAAELLAIDRLLQSQPLPEVQA